MVIYVFYSQCTSKTSVLVFPTSSFNIVSLHSLRSAFVVFTHLGNFIQLHLEIRKTILKFSNLNYFMRITERWYTLFDTCILSFGFQLISGLS